MRSETHEAVLVKKKLSFAVRKRRKPGNIYALTTRRSPSPPTYVGGAPEAFDWQAQLLRRNTGCPSLLFAAISPNTQQRLVTAQWPYPQWIAPCQKKVKPQVELQAVE